MSPPAGGRKAAKPAREGNDVTAQRLEAASQIDWGAISASQCALRRPSLGVHLTLDLGGQAKFGPDVQWQDSPDDYRVDASRADAFYDEVRRYWPGLPDAALQPAYAGIRPKLTGPGEPAADFVIQGPREHGVAGLVNLFGIESPGLTASLAIAEHVAGMVET